MPIAVQVYSKITTFEDQLTEFKAKAFSVDNQKLKFEWDFDGDEKIDQVSYYADIRHKFSKTGNYKTVLKVSDEDGFSVSSSIDITVNAGTGNPIYNNHGDITLPTQIQIRQADGVTTFYAIMINGGSEERFWDDVHLTYSKLIDGFRFTDERIYLLNYDGNNPYGENPNNMIDFPADSNSLDIVFNELINTMDGDDVLLVWVTDHGGGYVGENSFWEGGAYYGFSYSEPEIDPGDEEDYLESDFKLRSLFTGGDFRTNHGIDVWKFYHGYYSIYQANKIVRYKYVSRFDNVEFSNGSIVSDDDIFIEKFTDLLLGDTNQNGFIEYSLGEVEDYDDDMNPPYNPDTGEFDEDDWGLVDELHDNYNYMASSYPGERFCLFDEGFDNRLDIDINCACNDLSNCGESLLEVDGTDLDNQGLFDGMDVNDDGDYDDWVSIDEFVYLPGYNFFDDELEEYLDLFDIQNVIVFMLPCFSGGFIDDLSKDNTVIMTAAVEEDVSWGNTFIRSWIDALYDIQLADTNGDGMVSMVESFNYASEQYCGVIYNDTRYDDNADYIGHSYPIPNADDGYLGINLFIPQNNPDEIPTAVIDMPVGAYITVPAGEVVQFSGHGEYNGFEVTNKKWDFNGDYIGHGVNNEAIDCWDFDCEYTFSDEDVGNTYIVRFWVADYDLGIWSEPDTIQVTITPRNNNPPTWNNNIVLDTGEDSPFWTMDLWNHVQDDYNIDSQLTLELAAPYPPSNQIPECYITNNRYFSCSTPYPNWNGFTYQGIKATDTDGAIGYAQIKLLVNPVNDAPTAEILSPANGLAHIGYTVSFTGEGYDSDPGDYITNYVWSSNGVDFSNQQNPTYTFPGQGSYIIRLEVVDSYGVYSEPDMITISILPPNQPSNQVRPTDR